MVPPLLTCVRISLPTKNITRSDWDKLKAWLRWRHSDTKDTPHPRETTVPCLSCWLHGSGSVTHSTPSSRAFLYQNLKNGCFWGAEEEPSGPLRAEHKTSLSPLAEDEEQCWTAPEKDVVQFCQRSVVCPLPTSHCCKESNAPVSVAVRKEGGKGAG